MSFRKSLCLILTITALSGMSLAHAGMTQGESKCAMAWSMVQKARNNPVSMDDAKLSCAQLSNAQGTCLLALATVSAYNVKFASARQFCEDTTEGQSTCMLALATAHGAKTYTDTMKGFCAGSTVDQGACLLAVATMYGHSMKNASAAAFCR